MSVNSAALFQAAAAAPADRPSEGIPIRAHVAMMRMLHFTTEFRDGWERGPDGRMRRVVVEVDVVHQDQEMRDVDGNME